MSSIEDRSAGLSLDRKRALVAKLLREKAGGHRPAPKYAHRMFEERAMHAPESVAVTSGEVSWTYGELDARSNRLARRLRAAGLGPEDIVAIALPRTPGLLVAILAVFKAGAAYLPVDTGLPQARVAHMLGDAAVAAVLTDRDHREQLPDSDGPVLCVDDAEWHDEGGGETVSVDLSPDHLAYVIYTSGSTGKPKAVMVTHAALTNLLRSMAKITAIAEDDALLAVTTLSFDIAALELLMPLCVGARVEIATREVASDGVRLAERLAESGASFLQATPATWRMLLDSGWAGSPALKMLCGGEALPRSLARRLLEKGRTLWNVYGPTETTIWSSVWQVEPGDGAVPIGRPIANTKLYVLDKGGWPSPVGVAGELHIGGLGLTRGYLGRPGQTAERFVPDPFGEVPGARLYRTGDLARWRADGQLECLGRIDHQLKIRGFRIEAGEVETALVAHPSIREAVVLGVEDGSGELALVAYLIADPASASIWPATAELRRFLASTLPGPMIPSAFVTLDAWPLTPNGKLDRKALPCPDRSTDPASAVEFVPPRGPAEEIVAAAWASVLGISRVGALDNFFDLGGHSLLATQVMSRLREGFGVEVPLRALFDGPTVAGLAERIEAIQRMGERRDSAPIMPAPKGSGPRPLSFAQEALWVLHSLAPDRPTFNISAAVRISGPLDLEALSRAVETLVDRHESLRTTFETVDGQPMMAVAPSLKLPMEVVDLAGLSPESQRAEAVRLASEEARHPFDLARGPLVRVVVLKLGESDQAVLLAMHHIMTDGWSFAVAARELSALYEAHRQGVSSPLPPLPIQYADFAVWQRERRQGSAWAEQVEVWRQRLAGVPPLELPTDRPRPPVRSMRGALRSFSIPTSLSDGVRDLGRRAGVTPFMTLLAAFQVVLSRWSGQDDFAIGSPVANRTRAETESLIGYLVNLVGLRADLSGDPTGLELLARVREVSLEAFEYQEIPLEVVIDALAPRRDASRTPLFQVMFVLQNNAMPDIEGAGLALAPLDLPASDTGTAKFDLTLALSDGPEGFLGTIESAVDLFDGGTIDRLIRHFLRSLEAIVDRPDARLSSFSLASDVERRLVLDDWSGAGERPGPAPLVHHRFEALARDFPDATALVSTDARWTYADMNTRANRLARLLINQGVGPESRVALALSRPSSQLSAILAVLKAGGAYLPIDPTAPAGRLEEMLVDARVSIAIVEGGAPAGWNLPTIDLDEAGAELGSASPTNPEVATDGANLAYIVFTSGSTGRPKGVEVTQGSLASAASAWADAYGLQGRPIPHLQAAPFAFDVFAGDWVRALGTGGSLVACPREILIDPPALVALMLRERVGCVELVPPVAEALAVGLERQSGGLPDLRLLAVGSDTLRAGLYGRLRRLLGPTCRVVNSYGLTEATVDSSFFEGDWPGVDDRPVPIGRAFAGTRLYILDRMMLSTPPGVPGELYVGGAGVARGYASDPGRTAVRFVPDPFGSEPGARLYRTGDRARWLEDGQMELLGRLDGQVKVRGQRVELGEVEAALLRHESVAEAVAVASPAGPDGVRLIAYVAGPPGLSVPIEEVRRSLRERLPQAMIPSRIEALEALPRTPSGKVDREALPPPSSGERSEAFVPPRDDLERRIAAIWEDLLGVRPIGATDDFFDLGGHSLLAVRLAARVEEEFGRSLPLSSLFRSTTIEGLADQLRDPIRGSARLPVVEFGDSGNSPSLAMVHPVSGGILCYGQLARLLDGKFSLFGFQATGLEDDGEPEFDLVEMASRYVKAFLEVRPDGPYRLGGWSMGGEVAFEMARQLEALGRQVDLIVLIDTMAPGRGRGLFGGDERDYLAAFANDLVQTSGSNPDPLIRRLKRVDVSGTNPGEFDPSVFGPELLAEYGPARLRRHFEVYRANRRATAGYRPAAYQGRAVLIRAEESRDWSSAWRALAKGGLTTYTLPGDHVALLRRPAVERLAEILARESGIPTEAKGTPG